jgi:hypothetical protein
MKFLRIPQPKTLLGNKVLYVPIHTVQCITIAGNWLFLRFQGYEYTFQYNSEKESQQAADAFMKQLTKEKSFTLSPQDIQTQRMDMPAPCSLTLEELK